MALPGDKIDKLVERTAEKIYETTKREYKDLRSHEVPAQDALSIVRRAVDKTWGKVDRSGADKDLEQ